MAAVRGRNTKPEVALRQRLHALGLRYRLNVRSLPGTPDLVFARFDVALFVHGCFWHGHDCPLFVVPRTRTEFWLAKIAANQTRDRRNHKLLLAQSWRIATVWECALRGRASPGVERTAIEIAQFLRDDKEPEMYARDDGAHLGSGYGETITTSY